MPAGVYAGGGSSLCLLKSADSTAVRSSMLMPLRINARAFFAQW
jgi:hypothetical protein